MEGKYGPLVEENCALVADDEEGVAMPSPTSRGKGAGATALKTVAKVAAAGAALVGVAWYANTHAPSAFHTVIRGSPEIQMKDATWVQGYDLHGDPYQSRVGMDIDVDYVVPDGTFGTNYDHIPDPEMCAAMCQGVDACNAWTWVRDAGLDGNPSQCWLKGAAGSKVPKAGLVSGLIPQRKPFVVPPPKDSTGGTTFCWSLMVPWTDEIKLLKFQHDQKISIFACDAARVYSNQAISIADGVTSLVVNSTLKCEYGGDSQSALNSWIFIAVWYKIVNDAEYRAYDWVVKADPDCVFFPDRLGRLLAQYPKSGYINNCRYGMHGPIEVFSREAIDYLMLAYKDSWDGRAPKRCVEELEFGQWGEDMFIDQCLSKTLNINPRTLDAKLMCEAHCDCPAWYWCDESADIVSYHPFKSVESYKNCMANALGAAQQRKLHK